MKWKTTAAWSFSLGLAWGPPHWKECKFTDPSHTAGHTVYPISAESHPTGKPSTAPAEQEAQLPPHPWWKRSSDCHCLLASHTEDYIWVWFLQRSFLMSVLVCILLLLICTLTCFASHFHQNMLSNCSQAKLRPVIASICQLEMSIPSWGRCHEEPSFQWITLNSQISQLKDFKSSIFWLQLLS